MPQITVANARNIGKQIAQDLPDIGAELAVARLMAGLCEAADLEPLTQVVLLVTLARRIESKSGRNDLFDRVLESSALVIRQDGN